MARIRLLSDIHHEHHRDYNKKNYEITELENDSETILVLAGDIDHRDHTVKRLVEISERFKYIVCVYGNHDLWKAKSFYDAIPKAKRILEENNIKNVFILQNEEVILDQIRFIGTTLWTDYNHNNPWMIMRANEIMNDYKYIKATVKGRKIRPVEILAEHNVAVKYIKSSLEVPHEGPTVVVTHHAPTELSINEKYKGDIDNPFYYSDLSNLILDYNPDYWFHGHVHDQCNYMMGDCNVICNPAGYPGEIPNFDPDLVIEIPNGITE